MRRWQGRCPSVGVETVEDASSVRVDVAQRVHDAVALAAGLADARHARPQRVVHVHLARLQRQHHGWRRGVVVSGVRRMNEVNARRARLVLRWVTVFGRVYHLGM